MELSLYREQTFAESTKKSYDTHRRSYIDFCLRLGYQPVPVTKLNLARYAVFLARRLKPQSISKYLNIVRLLHIEADLPNPLQDNWLLKSLLTGIKRAKGCKVNKKLPITPQLLLRIKRQLDFKNPLDVVFWAICLTAFFTFLRKSNLLPATTTSFDPQKQLARQDFKTHSWGLSVTITWSKTIQFNERSFQIPLPILAKHPLCPVMAILQAFRAAPSDPQGPAFMVPGNPPRPFLYSRFLSMLKSYISKLNLPSGEFSGHSFRRGGASWAFQSLLPSESIKAMGDWKSDAYLQYLEIPLHSKLHHMRIFSTNLPTH